MKQIDEYWMNTDWFVIEMMYDVENKLGLDVLTVLKDSSDVWVKAARICDSIRDWVNECDYITFSNFSSTKVEWTDVFVLSNSFMKIGHLQLRFFNSQFSFLRKWDEYLKLVAKFNQEAKHSNEQRWSQPTHFITLMLTFAMITLIWRKKKDEIQKKRKYKNHPNIQPYIFQPHRYSNVSLWRHSNLNREKFLSKIFHKEKNRWECHHRTVVMCRLHVGNTLWYSSQPREDSFL